MSIPDTKSDFHPYDVNTITVLVPLDDGGSEGERARRDSSKITEGDDHESEFLEELLERIMARMPFPSLFKARVLSKRWYFKFPFKLPFVSQVVSSLESSWFQGQVSANSANWKTYSPVFLNKSNLSLLAFDRTKSQWFGPITLSHVPASTQTNAWCSVVCAGALILIAKRPYALGSSAEEDGKDPSDLLVCNVLTGSCRRLTVPSLPESVEWDSRDLWTLIVDNCDSYKVLIVYFVDDDTCEDLLESDSVCVRLYDSRTQTWSFTQDHISLHPNLINHSFFFQSPVYMNGKLYGLAAYAEEVPRVKLVSYHVEDNAWDVVFDGFKDVWPFCRPSGIFRCGEKIIVVTSSLKAKLRKKNLESWDKVECPNEGVQREREDVEAVEKFSILYTRKKSIRVFQLDLQSSELVSMSNGPPEIMLVQGNSEVGGFRRGNVHLSSDANSVYCGQGSFNGIVIKFDLTTREWSSISPASSTLNDDEGLCASGSFQPGVNPFVSA